MPSLSPNFAPPAHLYAFEPPPFEGEEFPLTVSLAGEGAGTVTSSPAGISCPGTCSAKYKEGQLVTLTAAPAAGSAFAGWSGACSGSGECKVTMSEAKEVTAEFKAAAKAKFLLKVKKAGSGEGTVASSPAGIECGPDCEELYEEGTAVTLTGSPGAGTKAVLWSGCDSVNGEDKCLVSISSAKEVTATFDLEAHLLSVTKEGTGSGKVTSSPAGIDCGATCSASGECKVTMSEAKAVTAGFESEAKAKFALKLTLEEGEGTVASSPAGIECSGAAPKACEAEFEEGASVTLTASPASGYAFKSWKKCDSVNGRQCTMTISAAKALGAKFVRTQDLTVKKTAGSTGLGKVSSSPGGILCLYACTTATAAFAEGSTVKVLAVASKGSEFSEWIGACSGSGACEVTMSEAETVEAKFTEIAKLSLTVNKSGGGNGTVKSLPAGINCGAICSTMAASFYKGTLVALTATPGKGSTFNAWTGACSGSGACEVTMSEAKEVGAEFK